MLRRLSVLAALWVVLLALLSNGTAFAQDEDTAEDEDSAAEVSYYGDSELIEVLRNYGLLDEWIAASPVSPQASLLLVSGNGSYQAQRQDFLNSLDAWANRTELVRTDLARIDAAQENADRFRSAVTQVRDALVLDDRLAPDSKTLAEMEDALDRLALAEIPAHEPEHSEDPLTLAEVQLTALRDSAAREIEALNGMEPAITSSGVEAFVGYSELQVGFDNVDRLIERGRKLIKPAREESERLVSSALGQIPSLHASRMLGSSDVGGLSVVTVDAYIRAAASSSCSVDWALLAGIGKIESNHGRIGGASVSRSGQVSTTILGPLLDGGETEREETSDDETQREEAEPVEAEPDELQPVPSEAPQFTEVQQAAIAEAVKAARTAAQAALENSLGGLLGLLADTSSLSDIDDVAGAARSAGIGPYTFEVGADPEDEGNGFAVVVDTDDGQLDGNDQWDRAVGPMQFLPETWSRWATDGNGDGVSDPHNLYDAAASAARFLCHLSSTRGPSPSTFVLGYNSSTSYVRSVLSTANNYRSVSLPS